MLDFTDFISSARYLYRPNGLPLTQLLMKSNLDRLNATFRFQNQQSGVDINLFQLLCSAGEFEGIPIVQLSIEAVAINLAISGEKDDLDRVYNAVLGFLVSIDPKKRMETPQLYTTTYQAQSSVHLSFSADHLISPVLMKFVNDCKPAFEVPSKDSNTVIKLSNLAFEVSFTSRTPDYVYLPKLLRIEPRTGSRPEDRLYFVQTPTDSTEHIRLVEELDKLLSSE